MTQQQPSAAMAVIDPRRVPMATQVFGEERLQLLAEQVGRGWKVPPTPAELETIAVICRENRWDIFAKPAQVHFIKRWDSKLGKEVMTPQPSIDGMRLAASRNRNYIGPAGWSWCGDDGVWKDVWLSPDPPRAARAGILVRGSRQPLYAVALWDEWAQWQDEYAWDQRQGKNVKTGEKVLGAFWASKPAHMLAKTAEMIIIKQACPAETDKFELAHLEELDRLEAPALAAEYARIWGADEAHAFAELPAAYQPTRDRDVDDQPRTEPTTEDEWDRGADPPVLTTPAKRAAGVARREEAPPTPPSRSPASPGRTYAEVFPEDAQAAPTAAELAAPRDPATGEVLDDREPKEKPKIAAWAENRELVSRATALGLQGLPTLNNRSAPDVVAEANRVLLERITNAELDRKLDAEQKRSQGEML